MSLNSKKHFQNILQKFLCTFETVVFHIFALKTKIRGSEFNYLSFHLSWKRRKIKLNMTAETLRKVISKFFS